MTEKLRMFTDMYPTLALLLFSTAIVCLLILAFFGTYWGFKQLGFIIKEEEASDKDDGGDDDVYTDGYAQKHTGHLG